MQILLLSFGYLFFSSFVLNHLLLSLSFWLLFAFGSIIQSHTLLGSHVVQHLNPKDLIVKQHSRSAVLSLGFGDFDRRIGEFTLSLSITVTFLFYSVIMMCYLTYFYLECTNFGRLILWFTSKMWFSHLYSLVKRICSPPFRSLIALSFHLE